MHKIDLHNYEAYLLDFSEGTLSDESQMELELFLIQHPELNIDLDELSLITLENEAATFSNKNSLKKSETDLVSEEQFIAYIENQLSASERSEVDKSCSVNPLLLKELNLYKNSIVKADESVVFQNKNELKRKPKVIWFNFSTTQFAAAASILFLIGLYILWPKTESTTNPSQIANNIVNPKTSITKNNTASHKDEVNSTTTITTSTIAIAQKPFATTHSFANKSITKQHEANTSVIRDTLTQMATTNVPIQINKTEIIISQNSPTIIKQNVQSVVQVITENDDEIAPINNEKQKKGIWAAASRALKNLNSVGVKGVNGDEEKDKENTSSYALTLGGLNITHKAGL